MKKNKKPKSKYSLEGIICIIITILTFLLLIVTIKCFYFFPSLIIVLALLLFSICSLYRDDKEKEVFVNVLYGIGIALIIFSVIYTVVNMV